ncbi:MAG: ATP-binding protein [Phycisphaerae bacterium]
MRLADFIVANVEPILAEWEVFARGTEPGPRMDRLALRDHAGEILRATARDMGSAQTAEEQSDKSMGLGGVGPGSARLDGASVEHAVGRVGSGFDLPEVVAEYRALRASVIRLWRASEPAADDRDLADLTRFNESIDQSLTTAVTSYTERVDHSRETFLAILGHDLRNPLNAVSMSAELLATGDDVHPETLDAARRIASAADVMARMISDLLDYTRTRLGAGLPVERAPVDAAALARAVVDEFRAGHPDRAITLTTAGDPRGDWDALRLRQAISNLLANALQHGDDGAAVAVHLAGTGGGIGLSVHNGGRPIPASALPTLFDPLVRGTVADSPAHRRPGSIGLGLYIVREVATAHGGTIDVTSTADAGTTFTLCLPRAAPSR